MGELIYLEFFGERNSSPKRRDHEVWLARERERWRRDLNSWPVAFHAGGQLMIARLTDPERAWTRDGLCVLRDAREELSGHYHYPTLVRYRLYSIRSAIRDLREAQERGQRAAIRECQATLEYERDDLLGCLWLFGRRRIERADIESHAVKEVGRELRHCLDSASRCDEHARKIRDRLAAGVYPSAEWAKKGRPLAPGYRHALEQQVVGAERIAHRHRERAREIQSISDPLRAWGLYG